MDALLRILEKELFRDEGGTSSLIEYSSRLGEVEYVVLVADGDMVDIDALRNIPETERIAPLELGKISKKLETGVAMGLDAAMGPSLPEWKNSSLAATDTSSRVLRPFRAPSASDLCITSNMGQFSLGLGAGRKAKARNQAATSMGNPAEGRMRKGPRKDPTGFSRRMTAADVWPFGGGTAPGIGIESTLTTSSSLSSLSTRLLLLSTLCTLRLLPSLPDTSS